MTLSPCAFSETTLTLRECVPCDSAVRTVGQRACCSTVTDGTACRDCSTRCRWCSSSCRRRSTRCRWCSAGCRRRSASRRRRPSGCRSARYCRCATHCRSTCNRGCAAIGRGSTRRRSSAIGSATRCCRSSAIGSATGRRYRTTGSSRSAGCSGAAGARHGLGTITSKSAAGSIHARQHRWRGA